MKRRSSIYVSWVLFIAAGMLVWLGFVIPLYGVPYAQAAEWFVPDIGYEYFPTVFCYAAVAFIAVGVVLARKLPLLEAVKPLAIIFFFEACLPFTLLWPLWVVAIGLSVLNLLELKKTNGKKGTAITCTTMSAVGLGFVFIGMLGIWGMVEISDFEFPFAIWEALSWV